jgi:hypothetical protein
VTEAEFRERIWRHVMGIVSVLAEYWFNKRVRVEGK